VATVIGEAKLREGNRILIRRPGAGWCGFARKTSLRKEEMRGFIALILGYFLIPFAYAQTDSGEILSITTYYPSPYGDYHQVEVRRSVKFTPLDLNTPLTNPLPQSGELAYGNDNSFHYYTGSNWQAMSSSAGSSGSLITVSCPWHSDNSNTAQAGKGDGTQCGKDGLSGLCCTPPLCPNGWTAINGTHGVTYPEIAMVSCPNSGGCEWNDATDDNHPVVVGNVIRVCGKN
jgi:hypothetical protein